MVLFLQNYRGHGIEVMKKIISSVLIIIFLFLLTGCVNNEQKTVIREASECKEWTKTVSRGIESIYIIMDTSNLNVYCWNKKEIKCDIHNYARGKKTMEDLDKILKKYHDKYEEKEKNGYITINNEDIISDVTLTIPKSMNLIVNQKSGSLKIIDRFEAGLIVNAVNVSSEINEIQGNLQFIGDNGYVHVNSGRLTDGSSVSLKNGNIIIKAECIKNSKYDFQTVKGNIDLSFPVSSDINIQSFGTVQNNQFTGVDGSILMNVSTKIGKISVNGY